MKRPKPPGVYVGSESSFQSTAIRLVRMMVGNAHALVCHVPNGRNAGSVRMGGFWKGQGVVSGVPDILVFVRSFTYSGLAIELKVWPNKPSPEQVFVHEQLTNEGWRVVVCYGVAEVEAAVKAYLYGPLADNDPVQLLST